MGDQRKTITSPVSRADDINLQTWRMAHHLSDHPTVWYHIINMAIHFTTPLTVSRSQSLTQEPYHQYVILHMTDHSFTHSVYDETSRWPQFRVNGPSGVRFRQSLQWPVWRSKYTNVMLPTRSHRDKKDGSGGQQWSAKHAGLENMVKCSPSEMRSTSITSDEVLLLLPLLWLQCVTGELMLSTECNRASL